MNIWKLFQHVRDFIQSSEKAKGPTATNQEQAKVQMTEPASTTEKTSIPLQRRDPQKEAKIEAQQAAISKAPAQTVVDVISIDQMLEEAVLNGNRDLIRLDRDPDDEDSSNIAWFYKGEEIISLYRTQLRKASTYSLCKCDRVNENTVKIRLDNGQTVNIEVRLKEASEAGPEERSQAQDTPYISRSGLSVSGLKWYSFHHFATKDDCLTFEFTIPEDYPTGFKVQKKLKENRLGEAMRLTEEVDPDEPSVEIGDGKLNGLLQNVQKIKGNEDGSIDIWGFDKDRNNVVKASIDSTTEPASVTAIDEVKGDEALRMLKICKNHQTDNPKLTVDSISDPENSSKELSCVKYDDLELLRMDPENGNVLVCRIEFDKDRNLKFLTEDGEINLKGLSS